MLKPICEIVHFIKLPNFCPVHELGKNSTECIKWALTGTGETNKSITDKFVVSLSPSRLEICHGRSFP
jgi:hypothetical protein